MHRYLCTFVPLYQAKAIIEAKQGWCLPCPNQGQKIATWALPTFSSQWQYEDIEDIYLVQKLSLFKELGRRVRRATETKRSFPFLIQQVVVTIQKANCFCVI